MFYCVSHPRRDFSKHFESQTVTVPDFDVDKVIFLYMCEIDFKNSVDT